MFWDFSPKDLLFQALLFCLTTFPKLMQMTLLILSHICFKWADTNLKVMAEEGHGHRHLTFALAFFLTETKWKSFKKVVCEEKKQ